MPLSCESKLHWHSQSIDNTVESSSLPTEDGISIFRKHRKHHLRTQSSLQQVLPLVSMMDNRNSRQPPVFSFQEVLQQRPDLCLRRFRLHEWA